MKKLTILSTLAILATSVAANATCTIAAGQPVCLPTVSQVMEVQTNDAGMTLANQQAADIMNDIQSKRAHLKFTVVKGTPTPSL